MSLATYAALANKQESLIRKPLDGGVFLADEDEDPIEVLTDDDGFLLDLPAGTGVGSWDDLGLLPDSGVTFNREQTSEDVTSFGRVSPSRTDVTTDTTNVDVACQETKAKTIAMASGADLSALVPSTGGEVKIVKPARPNKRYYRMLSIAVDEDPGAGEIYIARFFPRVTPSSFAAFSMQKGAEIQWGATMRASVDPALGYSEAWYFGGPGWKALLAQMGFAAPAAVVPRITTRVPASGPAAGGQMVEITGHNFSGVTGATGVKFGDTNASSYYVVDATTIVAVTPAHAAGAAQIVVTNVTGPSTSAVNYTYT